MAVRFTKEVKELCDREKIKFLVVLLPTKMDTERASDLAHIERVEQLLGMKPMEGDINRKITLRYAAELEKMKVPYLDPYEQMRKSSKELFYKVDYHLNVNGHDALADIVLESRFIQDLPPEKVSMNRLPSLSAAKRPLKDQRRRKFQGRIPPLGENRS